MGGCPCFSLRGFAEGGEGKGAGDEGEMLGRRAAAR